MKNTGIRWTEHTWNWCRGCTRDGAPCANCYATLMTARFSGPGQYGNGLAFFDREGHAQWTGEVRVIEEKLKEPLSWREPSLIFVNSMSDTFHAKVPDRHIRTAFGTMKRAHWHTFQVLTKRAERMEEFLKLYGQAPDNVWCGVSVGDRRALSKLTHLAGVPAKVRWVSAEPLVEDLAPTHADFEELVRLLKPIQWVVIGGESGPGARRMMREWAIKLRDAARAAGCRIFFKQWGMYGPDGTKHQGKHFKGFDMLDGERLMEYPGEYEASERLMEKHGEEKTKTPKAPARPASLPGVKNPVMVEAGRKAWATRRSRAVA
jgi:protein gp37